MKLFYLIVFELICFISLASPGLAFDSDYVHVKINENASGQAGIDLYLQRQLVFSGGLSHKFNKIEGMEWLRKGGRKEDESARWFNHFHDPLQASYADAGFKGLRDILSSSLVWAQSSEKNDASWPVARQLFYEALTTGSEERYANLFLTVGRRVMGSNLYL